MSVKYIESSRVVGIYKKKLRSFCRKIFCVIIRNTSLRQFTTIFSWTCNNNVKFRGLFPETTKKLGQIGSAVLCLLDTNEPTDIYFSCFGHPVPRSPGHKLVRLWYITIQSDFSLSKHLSTCCSLLLYQLSFYQGV